MAKRTILESLYMDAVDGNDHLQHIPKPTVEGIIATMNELLGSVILSEEELCQEQNENRMKRITLDGAPND